MFCQGGCGDERASAFPEGVQPILLDERLPCHNRETLPGTVSFEANN